VFVGDVFEADPTMRQVKSLLLDFFRGRQVESINLKGLDRVIFVTQHPESKLVLFRQYSVRYKRSGEALALLIAAAMSAWQRGVCCLGGSLASCHRADAQQPRRCCLFTAAFAGLLSYGWQLVPLSNVVPAWCRYSRTAHGAE
jgi:hypothetical protein